MNADTTLVDAKGIEEPYEPYRVIQRVEDIRAWQVARELVKEIYALTRTPAIRSDFGFRDQLQRAAVSIPSNIAEGYERDFARELQRFLLIAKGSCAEVRTLLYLGSDIGHIDPETFGRLLALTERTGQLIGAFRVSAAKQSGQQRPR